MATILCLDSTDLSQDGSLLTRCDPDGLLCDGRRGRHYVTCGTGRALFPHALRRRLANQKRALEKINQKQLGRYDTKI